MTTEQKKRLVKFVGKCLYSQVYPGQERSPHPKAVTKNPDCVNDKTYQITVECSEELFKKLIKAGLSRMTELKEIDDKTYITVRASKKKYSKSKDKMYIFDDPVVIDADDEPMTSETLIGNGSDVEVTAELAPLGDGIVMRLEKVKVINLIPYVKPTVESEIAFEEGNSVPSSGTKKQTPSNKDKNFF